MYATIAFGFVVTAFVMATVQSIMYMRDGFWTNFPVVQILHVLGLQSPGSEWIILNWFLNQELAIFCVAAAGLATISGNWMAKREKRRLERMMKRK